MDIGDWTGRRVLLYILKIGIVGQDKFQVCASQEITQHFRVDISHIIIYLCNCFFFLSICQHFLLFKN